MREISSHRRRALKQSLTCLWMYVVLGCCFSGAAYAHGGGLDADGCHTNRKTGEYHCHRGGGSSSSRSPSVSDARPARANALMTGKPTSNGPTCYTGPRGGTYTITASGRKNYGGC